MTMFSKAGDILHDQLIAGSAVGGMAHITGLASVGAGLGALNGLASDDGSVVSGAISGGISGALGGVASRYAAKTYAKGVTEFIGATVDSNGVVLKGVNTNADTTFGKFKVSNFTTSSSNKIHQGFFEPDLQSIANTKWGTYNPAYAIDAKATGAITKSPTSTGKP